MKKNPSSLLCILSAAAFLAGCQPTPQDPVVVQKDMEQLIEKAVAHSGAPDETQGTQGTQGARETTLADDLKAPGNYTASFEGYNGDLTVHADAAVTIPDSAGISAVRISRHYFTQEEADRMMEVFLQGETLYQADHPLTKAEIQDKLVQLYALRDVPEKAAAAGANPKSDAFRKTVQDDIQRYESLLADASETMELVPADTTFHPSGAAANPDARIIEGLATVKGKTYYLLINNGYYNENNVEAVFTTAGQSLDGSYSSTMPSYTIFNKEELSGVQPPETLSITGPDAKSAAEKLLAALHMADMACVNIQYAVMSEEIARGNTEPEQLKAGKWAYRLQYQRTVNGIPVTLTGHTGISSEAEVTVPWPYERVSIILDETGVVSFEYTSPYSVEDTVAESASMLDFAEIASVFERMFPIAYGYLAEEADYRLQADITEVRLGLMRITEQNNRSAGLLIPVWDFYGKLSAVPGKGEPRTVSGGSDSLLTINAIDGAIIDRNLGY